MMNRSKVSRVNELEKEVLLSAKAEKVEMTLNTSNAVASGLLIQRLTELYENPIEATVRETVSNALDAIAESFTGTRPEIRISVPTSLHPLLVIKDNGIGMTYDDLKEIYSKYGSSTKMDNLETIGAYGLGAKSPLAYGTEFTVTSVKNRQKTTIIVAREELTNYIKIVSSIETDEPSGTTVSVPVNTRDISKFSEYVDSYRNTPMDKDVDFYINGTLANDKTYTVITDKLVTYKSSKETVLGRVWINLKQAIEILNIGDYSLKRQIKFIIGGWSYSTPEGRSRSYYGSSKDLIYVELKPGIVGFNSSRDAILENDRYYDLENLVIEYVKSEQFATDLAVQINEMELDDFKQIMSKLLCNFRRSIEIKDDGISINQYGSGKNRDIKFSELTHKETGFNINQILNNVPKMQLSTIAFKEEKGANMKAAQSSIMSKDLSSYNVFERETITLINKTIDEVLIDESKSQDLNNLMINMTSLIDNFKNKLAQVKLTFVTDINDEEQIRQLKSGRKNLVRVRNGSDDLHSYTSIMIYTKHNKAEINKMIKSIEVTGLDIKVENADKIIEEIKEYRVENRTTAAAREKQVALSTGLMKLTETGTDYNVSLSSINDSIKNFVVVTKDGSISLTRMRMIHTWFCNQNNLKANEVEMYISRGMHTVIDLRILKSIFDTYIYRDPNSDNAGISNMYYDEVHNNIAQLNAVRNESVNTSEKAFMRFITGIYTSNPGAIMSELTDQLIELETICEVAGLESTKLPTENKEKFINFNTEIFGELNYSSNWELDRTALSHLASLVSKEHLQLAQNLLMLVNGRSFRMIDKEVHLEYTRNLRPTLDTIKEVYTEELGSKALQKLTKALVEAYVEFAKDTINQMLLLNL